MKRYMYIAMVTAALTAATTATFAQAYIAYNGNRPSMDYTLDRTVREAPTSRRTFLRDIFRGLLNGSDSTIETHNVAPGERQ